MPAAAQREDDDRDAPDDGRCGECRRRPAVGPCAACEQLICGDCGVLTSDPGGPRVICLSCARLIAAVRPRPARRRGGGLVAIALALLVAIAVAALSLAR